MQGEHYIFKRYIPFIFHIYVWVFVGNISYMCELQPIFRIILNTLLISSIMWHIYSTFFVMVVLNQLSPILGSSVTLAIRA